MIYYALFINNEWYINFLLLKSSIRRNIFETRYILRPTLRHEWHEEASSRSGSWTMWTSSDVNVLNIRSMRRKAKETLIVETRTKVKCPDAGPHCPRLNCCEIHVPFFVNSFDILSFNKCGRLLGHESSSRDKRERSRKMSFDEEGVSLVRDL